MVREQAPVKGARLLGRVVLVAVLVLVAAAVAWHPRTWWQDLTGGPGPLPTDQATTKLEPSPFGAPVRTGDLENTALAEASGLAASRRRPDVLWALNDSGSPPLLYAIGTDGRDRGVVEVAGATNVDWEDLAAFELDGRPYLLIADVGDNFARRASVMLYVVEEPPLAGDRFAEGATTSVAWMMELIYEDGPLDCEAVAVDPTEQRVLLVSKRTQPARLYEAPLRPVAGVAARVTATRVAEIPHVPRPTAVDLEEDPQFGADRWQITALDVAADGSELVAVTYKDAYRFPRGAGTSWADAVSDVPQLVTLPRMAQTEAGAYGSDGASFFVTSEQRPSPLFRLDRVESGAPATLAPVR